MIMLHYNALCSIFENILKYMVKSPYIAINTAALLEIKQQVLDGSYCILKLL